MTMRKTGFVGVPFRNRTGDAGNRTLNFVSAKFDHLPPGRPRRDSPQAGIVISRYCPAEPQISLPGITAFPAPDLPGGMAQSGKIAVFLPWNGPSGLADASSSSLPFPLDPS